MPTERPVPEVRVFLIRFQNLAVTLPPPQCVALLLAPHALRMVLVPEIPDEMPVVVEQELPNMPPFDVYDRLVSRQLAPGMVRVFDPDGLERRRYVLDENESVLVERYLQRHIGSVSTVLRNREWLTINDVRFHWTFDRLQESDGKTQSIEVVLGSVEYPADQAFPQAEWVMEEVTDKPLFRLPTRLSYHRARR